MAAMTIQQQQALALARARRRRSEANSGASNGNINAPSAAFTGALADASARSLRLAKPDDGLLANAGAGLDNGINTVLGAPVDLPVWLGNSLINATNSGAEMLGAGRPVPNIPTDLPGSRLGFERAQENLGFTPQSDVVANTTGERLARGMGDAVGQSILPEVLLARGAQAVAAGAQQIAPVIRQGVEMLEPMLGAGTTAGRMAANTAVNAAAGAGASVGADLAPEQFKPVAALAGGLIAGTPVALATAAPAAARTAGGVAADFAAPLTAGGRERIAGQTLREAATDPNAVMDAIDAAPPVAISGSRPTTFQQTGDMGLGALERGVATQNPVEFQTRRGEQNSARLDALGGVQRTGAPEQVASTVRSKISALDAETAAGVDSARLSGETRVASAETQGNNAVDLARRQAQESSSRVGTGRAPELVGGDIRTSLETARGSAKTRERALWEAVDPDGTLALPAAGSKARVATIERELTPVSARPEGEEAAIYSAVAGLPDTAVPFRYVTELDTRVKTAMRIERRERGETAAWRRLSMLKSSIEGDIDAAISRRSGQSDPVRSVSQSTSSLGVSSPNTGNAVFTPSGRRVDVAYEVVDANQITPSQRDDLTPNPDYDAALQPRNRTRAASDLQVARIAGDLQPERLGPSASAAEGAPIVGADGMVESGNARVLAIRRAYQNNGPAAQRYRDYLTSQGYDIAQMQNPVLVRRRLTEMDAADRVRFAQEANASPVLSMSAAERAATDASRLNDEILSLYRGGDIDSVANRDFVRAFVRNVSENGEDGAFATRDGAMSMDGQQRVRAALLHSAYRDGSLVEALAETGDENIRSFGKALQDVAGDVARLNEGIAAGRVDPRADISAPIVESARFVQEARRRNMTLSNALAQQDAFNTLSNDAAHLLRQGYGSGMAGRINRDDFSVFVRSVIEEAEQQTLDARLFGEPASISEIFDGVSARYGTTDQAGQQSRTATYNGSSQRADGYDQGRPADGSSGQGSAEARGPDGRRVIDEPTIETNFDQAARDRLASARSSTRSRAETFDNATLAPIRKRAMATGPYDMGPAAVPAKIFFPGSKSVDAIATYRNAVGDEQAMNILSDYVVDRLRRVAMRDDGTLDPVRVANFQRSHADALRAFPDLNARFGGAANASSSVPIAEAAKTKAVKDAIRNADEAIAAAAQSRKTRLDDAQRGSLGRLMNLEDPGDVVRTVGAIFSRQDAVNEIARLRSAIGDNAEGAEGLRKAIVDYVTDRFVSNAESGTTGANQIKADGFQTFVKSNKTALRTAGFTDAEVKVLQDIADDLRQANRSIVAVKLPGGSNTAQDALAAKLGDTPMTMMTKIAAAASTSGLGTSLVVGPWIGLPVGIATGLVGAMRQAGLSKVDDIIKDAMLNPQRARLLMQKVKPRQQEQIGKILAQQYRRAAVAGTAQGASD